MATRKKAASRKASTGISRIDQPATRTHGFFVRLGYRKTAKGWRPKHSAFFGDASHGGQTKALRAARSWRDEMSEEVARASRKKSTRR